LRQYLPHYKLNALLVGTVLTDNSVPDWAVGTACCHHYKRL